MTPKFNGQMSQMDLSPLGSIQLNIMLTREINIPILLKGTECTVVSFPKDIKKDLTMTDNLKLETIGFSSKWILGALVVKDNPVLTDVTSTTVDTIGSEHIDTTNSPIEFSNNAALETISFGSLITLVNEKYIRIQHNQKLSKIVMSRPEGLASAKISELTISNNPALTEIVLLRDSTKLLSNVQIFANKNMKEASLKAIRDKCDTNCYIQQEKECMFPNPVAFLSDLNGCEGVYGNLTLTAAVAGTTTTTLKYIKGHLIIKGTSLSLEDIKKFIGGAAVEGAQLSNNEKMCNVQAAVLAAIFKQPATALGGIQFLACITTTETPTTTALTTQAVTTTVATTEPTEDPNSFGSIDDITTEEPEEEFQTCPMPASAIAGLFFLIPAFSLTVLLGSYLWARRCELRLIARTKQHMADLLKPGRYRRPIGAPKFGFPLNNDMVFDYLSTTWIVKKNNYNERVMAQLAKFAKRHKFDAMPLVRRHRWQRAYYHEHCHPATDMARVQTTEQFPISPAALHLADHSRVKLNTKRWRMESDFFNASFIRHPREMPDLLAHPVRKVFVDELAWLEYIGNVPSNKELAEEKRRREMDEDDYLDKTVPVLKRLYDIHHPALYPGLKKAPKNPFKIFIPPKPLALKDQKKLANPGRKAAGNDDDGNPRVEQVDIFEDSEDTSAEEKRIDEAVEKENKKYKMFKYIVQERQVERGGLLRTDRVLPILMPYLEDAPNLINYDPRYTKIKKSLLDDALKGSTAKRLLRRKQMKEQRTWWPLDKEHRKSFNKWDDKVDLEVWNKKQEPVPKEKEIRRKIHKKTMKKTKLKWMRDMRYLELGGWGPNEDKGAELVKSWPAAGLHQMRLDQYDEKVEKWIEKRNKKTQKHKPIRDVYLPALFAIREEDPIKAANKRFQRYMKHPRRLTLLRKMKLRLQRLRRRYKIKVDQLETRRKLINAKHIRAYERGELTKRSGIRKKVKMHQPPFPDQLKHMKKRLKKLQKLKRNNRRLRVLRQRKKLDTPKDMYRRETKYICSQHPQKGQEYGFWSMVVDHHVKSIVAFGQEQDTLTKLPVSSTFSPNTRRRGGPRRQLEERKIHVDVERKGWLPPDHTAWQQPDRMFVYNEEEGHRPPQVIMERVIGFHDVPAEDYYTKEPVMIRHSMSKQCVLVSQLTVRVPSLHIRRTVYHFQYFNWETDNKPRMKVFMNLIGATSKIGGSVLAHDVEGFCQAPCFLGAAMLIDQVRHRRPMSDPLKLFRQMRQDRLGCLARSKFFLIMVHAVYYYVFTRYRRFFKTKEAPYIKQVRSFMKTLREKTRERLKH